MQNLNIDFANIFNSSGPSEAPWGKVYAWCLGADRAKNKVHCGNGRENCCLSKVISNDQAWAKCIRIRIHSIRIHFLKYSYLYSNTFVKNVKYSYSYSNTFQKYSYS